MNIRKTKVQARKLSQYCLGTDGLLDPSKTQKIAAELVDRNNIQLLRAFKKAIELKASQQQIIFESATVIDQGILDRIRVRVETKMGRKFTSEFSKNEDSIAGIKMQVNDLIYDYSIKGAFEQIKEKISS